MDFSNYPREHALYDESRKGKLGLLKSETADVYPSEIICLQPKCYSILLHSDSTKSTAKGVPHRIQAKLRHDQYRDIHNQKCHTHFETIYNIQAQACQLLIRRTVKNCLSKFETKRYYINACTSPAYGHPDIPKQTAKPVVSKKRKRSILEEYDDNNDIFSRLDLTWKICKPGEVMFGEFTNTSEASTPNSSGFIL